MSNVVQGESEAPMPTLSLYFKERSDLHNEINFLASRIYDIKAKLQGTPTLEDSVEKSAEVFSGQIDLLNKGNEKLRDIICWMNVNLNYIEYFLK